MGHKLPINLRPLERLPAQPLAVSGRHHSCNEINTGVFTRTATWNATRLGGIFHIRTRRTRWRTTTRLASPRTVTLRTKACMDTRVLAQLTTPRHTPLAITLLELTLASTAGRPKWASNCGTNGCWRGR